MKLQSDQFRGTGLAATEHVCSWGRPVTVAGTFEYIFRLGSWMISCWLNLWLKAPRLQAPLPCFHVSTFASNHLCIGAESVSHLPVPTPAVTSGPLSEDVSCSNALVPQKVQTSQTIHISHSRHSRHSHFTWPTSRFCPVSRSTTSTMAPLGLALGLCSEPEGDVTMHL